MVGGGGNKILFFKKVLLSDNISKNIMGIVKNSDKRKLGSWRISGINNDCHM